MEPVDPASAEPLPESTDEGDAPSAAPEAEDASTADSGTDDEPASTDDEPSDEDEPSDDEPSDEAPSDEDEPASTGDEPSDEAASDEAASDEDEAADDEPASTDDEPSDEAPSDEDEPADAPQEAPATRRVSDFDEIRDGGYGMGSAAALPDGAQPMDHPVQAYHDTMTYRLPDDPGYAEAEADVWFYDAGAAERSGFRRSEG